MHPRLHFTKFIVLSFFLHALMIVAAVYLIKPALTPLPTYLPVNIVNLPRETTRDLPPVKRPLEQPPVPVPRPIIPEKPQPRQAVPSPKKFGESDQITLPRTGAQPRTGIPEGADKGKEQGKEAGTTAPQAKPAPRGTGPLPFLSQNDIDDIARKGMPERRPGDDSVTLDTDEYKFISYNRWLKMKVENVLKYPELAAISGYQGVLFIKFDILKNGNLGDVEVLKSSGYKILDDEAVRSIRAAAPFQPLPDQWRMEVYSIRAAVIFYMGDGYIR